MPSPAVQEDLWFQKGGSVDMAWINRFMTLGLAALHRLGRWHALVGLGSEWARVTCGAFNEKVLPWLLQVGGWVHAWVHACMMPRTWVADAYLQQELAPVARGVTNKRNVHAWGQT